MNEPAIVAQGVSKKFLLGRRSTSLKDRVTGFATANRDEFWAVRNVSVEVPRGSMLGVIGHNGSGKSTFLRTLCGIYRPTEGEIRVRGRVTALLELGAGFHPDLTGRENVYMNGSVVGLDRAHMDSVMDDIVDMADIGSFFDAPIETYSSGMRARLGFAVSVQLNPEILLADEITAVGDIAFKQHGLERMKELRSNGTTIVQVSHNMGMMRSNCDHVLWLHHGEVRAFGPADEVVDEYQEQASNERAGRMIDSRTLPGKEPKKKRLARFAEATAKLIEADVCPDAMTGLTVTGSADGRIRVGEPFSVDFSIDGEALLRLLTDLDSPHADHAPEARVSVVDALGTTIGMGSAVELDEAEFTDGASGPTTVDLRCSIDPLALSPARYNLAIGVWRGPEPLVVRHRDVLVEPADATDGGDLVEIGGEWRIDTSTSGESPAEVASGVGERTT